MTESAICGIAAIRSAALAVCLATVVALAGCGRQPNTPAALNSTDGHSSTVASTEPQKVPFDRPERNEGISPSESLVPAPHRLPAGTPLTIRLQEGVSSASAHSGDSFEAILDEPIVVGGRTVAPRGAQVTGLVVAAKASGRLQASGYLRLTLASITVDGKTVPVQSSSIFVKGKSHQKRNWESIAGTDAAGALIGGGNGAVIGSPMGAAGGTGAADGKQDVGFGAERRLTFRLTDSIDLKG